MIFIVMIINIPMMENKIIASVQKGKSDEIGHGLMGLGIPGQNEGPFLEGFLERAESGPCHAVPIQVMCIIPAQHAYKVISCMCTPCHCQHRKMFSKIRTVTAAGRCELSPPMPNYNTSTCCHNMNSQSLHMRYRNKSQYLTCKT
jgi:hypothetical protein